MSVRYLATAPPNPLDGSTRLRYAFGNGLRPDVWEKFTRRYGVEKVVEFYAATEGNTNLFNNAGVSGRHARNNANSETHTRRNKIAHSIRAHKSAKSAAHTLFSNLQPHSVFS